MCEARELKTARLRSANRPIPTDKRRSGRRNGGLLLRFTGIENSDGRRVLGLAAGLLPRSIRGVLTMSFRIRLDFADTRGDARARSVIVLMITCREGSPPRTATSKSAGLEERCTAKRNEIYRRATAGADNRFSNKLRCRRVTAGANERARIAAPSPRFRAEAIETGKADSGVFESYRPHKTRRRLAAFAVWARKTLVASGALGRGAGAGGTTLVIKGGRGGPDFRARLGLNRFRKCRGRLCEKMKRWKVKVIAAGFRDFKVCRLSRCGRGAGSRVSSCPANPSSWRVRTAWCRQAARILPRFSLAADAEDVPPAG